MNANTRRHENHLSLLSASLSLFKITFSVISDPLPLPLPLLSEPALSTSRSTSPQPLELSHAATPSTVALLPALLLVPRWPRLVLWTPSPYTRLVLALPLGAGLAAIPTRSYRVM